MIDSARLTLAAVLTSAACAPTTIHPIVLSNAQEQAEANRRAEEREVANRQRRRADQARSEIDVISAASAAERGLAHNGSTHRLNVERS
ncbi:MAG: hypothetical protein K0V04_22030 [Deltaproteobacteria bacterium]|nr:hypothetical protein [Deltaproteobacteria bacterium]